MDPVTGEVIRYAIAPAVGLLTLWLSNRHNRSQAAEERLDRATAAESEAREARTERRYEERRAAFTDLIDVATRMREASLKSEYDGHPTPSDIFDWPQLSGYREPLREALSKVLLIGTKETRDAAERLRKTTEDFVWSWSTEDYRTMDQALIDFRDAARRDLGIEGGAPDTPSGKPAKHVRPKASAPPT